MDSFAFLNCYGIKTNYISLTTVYRCLIAELLNIPLMNFCFYLTVNHKDGEKDPINISKLMTGLRCKVKIKGGCYPCNRLWRPTGPRDAEEPTLSTQLM
jgi:hypothetical protein